MRKLMGVILMMTMMVMIIMIIVIIMVMMWREAKAFRRNAHNNIK